MDKEQLDEKLSALLDGELSDEERRELEALIEANPSVAREWHALRQMNGLFREMPRYEAPEELSVRIETGRKARPVSFGPSRLSRRPAWPLLAAAAAVVLILGLVVLQFPKSSTFNVSRLEQAPAGAAKGAVSKEEAASAGRPLDEAHEPREMIADRARRTDALPAPSPAPASPAPPAQRVRVAGETQEGRAEDGPAGQTQGSAGGQSTGDALQLGEKLSDTETESGTTPAELPAETAGQVELDETKTVGLEAGAAPPETAAETTPPAPELAPALAASEGAETPPSKPPAPSGVPGTIEDKRAGDRTFKMREDAWVQAAYDKQAAVTVARDSAEFNALIAKDPSLAEIAAFQEEVIFELEGVWYRLPPVKDTVQAATPSQP